jgi:hypothetical protein
MSNPIDPTKEQKPGDGKSEAALLRDFFASIRGFAKSDKSVLERLVSQFDAMFNGHPGTGVANPPPAAPPSVDPIPSEWDADFNGSIPPVAPITAPSANDPKTPPDWHLPDAHLTPAAPVAATPAPAMKVVTVEIPAEIADPSWACNVKISTEEWAIIEAYREKKYAAEAKIAEQQEKETLCNTTVIKFLELAIELYKECYVPYSKDRKQMFLINEKREEVFRVLLDKHLPQFKTEAAVYTAFDIVESIIETVLDNVSAQSKERYHWNLS